MAAWRNSLVLLMVVVAVAMAVINVRHQVRALTVQLEQGRAIEQQLMVDYSTRQVQQVAAAKNDKIMQQVQGQGMQRVDPSVTYYLTPSSAVQNNQPNAAQGLP